MREVFFYFFATLAVLSGLLVITRRNPLTAALYLVLAFFSLAGVYVLLDAFFLAAVQVAVYAGAIMVLFLFVIMLLNLGPEDLPPIMTRRVRWLYAAASGALVLVFLGLDLGRHLPAPTPGPAGEVGAIAERLFGAYLLPFEITAVLLLVAIVGSVALAHRNTGRTP